ncbi:MAG: phosphoribosylglycinamide formyltransferase [Bacteroidetes bacterium]|nr:phosphoribosylglycinamide formyltransferase [Bacteroidota bacterium]
MNIAIFASSNGSNAQKIIEYFNNNSFIKIAIVLSNNKNSYVLERAKLLNIPSFSFAPEDFKNSQIILEKLKEFNIEFIVLAGFTLKLPKILINSFPDRIVNIHPALLPKFGGKGMYGKHVHKAVIEAKEKVSGITIHYVNEKYDEGKIIFQTSCKVEKTDTIVTLAEKIHELEYRYYPEVIENVISLLEPENINNI